MISGPIRDLQAGGKLHKALYVIYSGQGTLFLVSWEVLDVLMLGRGWFISGAERSLDLLKGSWVGLEMERVTLRGWSVT
jgi:hypothetical protein